MLLIKQINDLDFFTVRPTLPLPPLPGCQFVHELSRAEGPSQQITY
jgi:hypothetical protein